MPSKEDKEDEDEDEEPPAEKAKRKSPEEGNRPPSDLARYDVIKVKMLGQLDLSHDLEGKHGLGKTGHQALGPSCIWQWVYLLSPGASGHQPPASAALHSRGDLSRTLCGPRHPGCAHSPSPAFPGISHKGEKETGNGQNP